MAAEAVETAEAEGDAESASEPAGVDSEAAEPVKASEDAEGAVGAEASEDAALTAEPSEAPETSEPDVPESAAAGTEAVAKGEVGAAAVTDSAAAVPDGADASRAVEAAQPAGQPPAGHFTVPTAVAVVPAAPARRPVVEGGFDFFGTQKSAPKATLDSVQNEDLADVVGPEALAVHKAESEAGFKPADARSREVGQVIDLTAHDETEQIDVHRLRTAAS